MLLADTARAQAGNPPAGFTLPPLPYAYDALEPVIDTETMTIHHDMHHAGYVAKLNAALVGHPEWQVMPLDLLVKNVSKAPEKIRTAVRNNGGGHWNHSLFWKVMAHPGTQKPGGKVLEAITASFGNLAAFEKQFGDAAANQFGSGWAWLVPGKEKPLAIVSTPNQDNPLMTGGPAPILGIDVWEHAYYLKYKNKRPDYIKAWMSVINWDEVNANLAKA